MKQLLEELDVHLALLEQLFLSFFSELWRELKLMYPLLEYY